MNNANPRRLRVLVNHAEPLLAAGLVAALQQQWDFETLICGIDAVTCCEAQVNVVITDYERGLALARETRCARAAPPILVLTTFDREHEVRVALEAGVRGYLLPGCALDELANSVRTLDRGARYLCLAVAQCLADSLTREALTAREADVLCLLARGQCNKTIACQLEIALGTVKSHVKGIMAKLGATSRTEAASIASHRGLVGKSALLPARASARLAMRARPAALYN